MAEMTKRPFVSQRSQRQVWDLETGPQFVGPTHVRTNRRTIRDAAVSGIPYFARNRSVIARVLTAQIATNSNSCNGWRRRRVGSCVYELTRQSVPCPLYSSDVPVMHNCSKFCFKQMVVN